MSSSSRKHKEWERNPFHEPASAASATSSNASDEQAVDPAASALATKKSQNIDAELAETRRRLERRKNAVKLLLLGQSESGKVRSVQSLKVWGLRSINTERRTQKYVIQLEQGIALMFR